MPLSKYDPYFGGQKRAASKAKKSMMSTYGPEKGEQVFYATKNKRKSEGKGKKSGGMKVGL